ncbi:MAG: ATP-binding cassette domain-containing protein [Bacteroidales bacterium]|nr:ATP-binding cassette domain-containing protein [Bacteroidales bacterium]
MIEVKKISKSFGNNHVLKNVSADFIPGKISMVIGKSGSGKTVLLKSVIGLHTPEVGEIFFDNREFINASIKFKRQIREEIGMVFQGGALFTSLTIEDNVRFALDLFTNMTKAEKTKRVDFCLERVNMANTNQLFPAEISGGMQKRVSIARAIVLNPKYLFCDEPNSGLDPQTAILIDRLIKEITVEYNMTTIVNTHDMNSVIEIADNIYFIHEGQKWWEGGRNDIFYSDNKELNEFVFASDLYKKIKDIAK